MKKIFPLAVVLFLLSCGTRTNHLVHGDGKTLETRFVTPQNYIRDTLAENSFGAYLRLLPLKAPGSPVLLFDGSEKKKPVYAAVVDLPIGKKDLHQCADAVMRLRAEYLFKQELYKDIHFNFTNGFRADYSEWRSGKRISVDGNKVSWIEMMNPSDTYESFWKYLETVFAYAGTLSLSAELKPVKYSEMQIGDVFIRGGSPGHAVIVVDMAIDPKSKRKVFMLAQSYMPAQEIQVLKNPNDAGLSPWFDLDFGDELITPEWKFSKDELKRFEAI